MRGILFLILNLAVSLVLAAAPTPNTQLCYQSKIDLPSIPADQKVFQQLVNQSLVEKQVAYTHSLSGLDKPESACNQGNYFYASYRVFAAPAGYISFGLQTESNFFMNAHPTINYSSLNYDITNQHAMTLDQIFTDEKKGLALRARKFV